ncbi:MAG: AraC family transcriptional regulator [Fusicatenibacter sp.]|nr:AraC family transcriptional regulator [Lachnospiraceae bacterium]MDY2937618.1 AraC family transcriptional regulator [Fusicatenibacter sp.]
MSDKVRAMRERHTHGSMLVPYDYYECVVPDRFPAVPLHWHKEWEINYVLEGEGMFRCEDRVFYMKTGDIILVQPNLLHGIFPAEGRRVVYETLVFRQEILLGSYDDRCYREVLHPLSVGEHTITVPITAGCGNYDSIRQAVKTMFACVRENRAKADLLLKSELLRIFYLVESEADLCRVSTEHTQNFLEPLRPVLAYMQKHYQEPLQVSDLADIANLSESYFMYRFKQTFGIGAIEYLNQLRIKTACDLLLDSDETAARIAFESGFRNLANFNRNFKKSVGCTPTEYRKTAR